MTTPIDLFASALHFHPGGDVRAAERQMTTGDSGAWQIAAFDVQTGRRGRARSPSSWPGPPIRTPQPGGVR